MDWCFGLTRKGPPASPHQRALSQHPCLPESTMALSMEVPEKQHIPLVVFSPTCFPDQSMNHVCGQNPQPHFAYLDLMPQVCMPPPASSSRPPANSLSQAPHECAAGLCPTAACQMTAVCSEPKLRDLNWFIQNSRMKHHFIS